MIYAKSEIKYIPWKSKNLVQKKTNQKTNNKLRKLIINNKII